MIPGVNEKEEKIIKDILKNYPYEFYYYGSRANGDFTRASDLDILIKGDEEMPWNVLSKLRFEFDESLIPYIVNFADYHKISPEFYSLIKDTLVKVF